MEKVLTINYQKCTGCRLCELVCSVMHDGVSNPARSQQCEDAPCLNVCPVKAVSRDEDYGFVAVDYDICIGCRSCVAVCPFGAMNYNVIDKKVFKCDLCGGNPQCVRFCEEKAVDYVDAGRVSNFKKKDAAERLSAAQKEAGALQAAM